MGLVEEGKGGKKKVEFENENRTEATRKSNVNGERYNRYLQ